ncbi:MAG: NAD(P)-dependent oxidoreductase [Chloroflexi bacterium]|nr:NAD(P)-dependent oxidoreductase [Chloroflexota bacterium]
MPRETVLITGINGFIGCHLARALLESGYEVLGLGRGNCKAPCSSYFQADILDADALAKAVAGADVTVHLAAVTAHSTLTGDPSRALQVNLIGTFNTLQAFCASRGRLFIYPSSGKVYGEPLYLPYNEKHPLEPQTFLGKIKKTAENIAALFADSSQKGFVVLRIFNVYGPGQSENFLVPTVISQLDSSHAPQDIVLGDIRAKRDYLYIDDAVRAIILILKARIEKLETLNLGSGLSLSAEEIVREMGIVLEKKINILVDKSRLRAEEPFEERADISRLQGMGFSPRISIKEGLLKTLQASGKLTRG